MRTAWSWHRNGHLDQRNSTESPETDPGVYRRLICDKGARMCTREKRASSRSAGNRTVTCQRMKLDHFIIPETKINSKWVKDLHVRLESLKLQKENISHNLSDTGLCSVFLDRFSQSRETKAKINSWEYIRIKSFAQPRKQPTKQQGNLGNGRRYLQMTYLIRAEQPL